MIGFKDFLFVVSEISSPSEGGLYPYLKFYLLQLEEKSLLTLGAASSKFKGKEKLLSEDLPLLVASEKEVASLLEIS